MMSKNLFKEFSGISTTFPHYGRGGMWLLPHFPSRISKYTYFSVRERVCSEVVDVFLGNRNHLLLDMILKSRENRL